MITNEFSSRTSSPNAQTALNILVVEDDQDDLELVQQALESFSGDLRVFSARNGQEALFRLFDLSTPEPDLIIMDLRMPRMDGRKCLAAIRADGRLKQIPVVIYSTSHDEDESVELKNLGAVHFMSKPTDPDDVYFLLSMVVEERWRDLANQKA